jgi:protein ATS1
MAGIYAIGSNSSGQLGISHKEDVSVPKPVFFQGTSPEKVTQIKAGGNHTLILSSNSLYCSGDSTSGACGLRPESTQGGSRFEVARLFLDEVISNYHAVFCSASWEASIIVMKDENGQATKVYSFGTGNKGELGLGALVFRSSKAQLIKDFPPPGLEVVDLAASVSHVVAVLNNGDVYGWGSGRKGQLGEPEAIVQAPRKISGIDFKVIRAVCGREFTFLIGEKEFGKHIILGSDKWNVKSAAPMEVRGWKDIGSSWGSIFVLFQEGKLISWGRNDHGQLPADNLPLLTQIAIGSEHALSLTTDGDVLAWGWGEHGNCGPSTSEGDVKGRWNVIASSKFLPVGSKICNIGAGCATSWICVSS